MLDAAAPTDIDVLLDRLDCLGGKPRRVSELSGGLTNKNLRVITDDLDVVVRISKKDSGMLAIDRDAEYANSRAAAEAGTSPRVLEYRADDHLLVVAFVPGRTLEPVDIGNPELIPRIADACRALHRGPRFISEFDMFVIQQQYLKTVQDNGFRLPPRYLEFMEQVTQIGAALQVQPLATVPCNNDLLAANFIADDENDKIWIIDFEYSGNNDPCFELGNVWSEATLGLDELESLVTSYFGKASQSRTARARLLGLMSKYGWTLWASIQHATSELDFDFWEWGMEKYDRAVEEFDDPGFETLLATAAAPD